MIVPSQVHAAVREELYGILRELEAERIQHVEAWKKSPEGHKEPCYVCERYEGRRQGIRRAIRRFGGRPRL